jgi:hypothetical protein
MRGVVMRISRTQLNIGVTAAYAASIAAAYFIQAVPTLAVLVVGAMIAVAAWAVIAVGEPREAGPSASGGDSEPGSDVATRYRVTTPPPF